MQYVTFLPEFFKWWYGRGIKDLISFLSTLFAYIENMFSVTVLLKTLFSPWKKMVSEKGRGIDGLKEWIVDNLISRGVGFVVRVIMLFVSVIIMALTLILGAVVFVLWLGMPAVIVGTFALIFIS